MNKIVPNIQEIEPIRYYIKPNITIDTFECNNLRKRTTTTPSPPPSPYIYIKPPPPTPIEKNIIINITPKTSLSSRNSLEFLTNDNNIENIIDKDEKQIIKNNDYIDIKNDMDFDLLQQNIDDIRNIPNINLRYDRINVHDYIYNYILFAYNFYNPIFTMYITIITYKQMNQFSSIFKNIVISYALIYPLIAMLILLNEAYYIYCKKFIYYKLMDNGVIFKWKKEYLYKSIYFWWYILSLIFICIGINDSWNVILMFINQTSNLCIYIYNSMNIESTLITLNGFFENNVNLQTENINNIIWIDEDKLKENVYSIIQAKNIINNNIDSEKKLLISSFIKNDDEEDNNILIMENFDKYKHLLNTNIIKEYYQVLQKIYPDIDIIGKLKLKRTENNITEYYCQFPFYKRKWVLTLLNELKQNYNIYWNHKCINCDLLKESNYYLCLICNSYLCESCNNLNTTKSLKLCYTSIDMDHKTINIYNNKIVKNKLVENKIEYPWYYKLYYHYTIDNIQIIYILDTIYYISIISILIIEFYGFYIIFT
jgi:hypothetical protein